jgi:hypothetical protein
MIFALIVVTAFSAGTSRADESDDLIQRGVELRRKGNDAEALDVFKRAYAIRQTGRSSAQLGLAEQALGMWTDAEGHITAALEHTDEPWIKKNRAALAKALSVVASHLGSLDVLGSPAGAEIVINGQAVAVLPLKTPLRVTAGTVPVTVRSKGYVEVTRVLDVPAGGRARERFDLTRVPVPAAPVVATPLREPRVATPLVAIHEEPKQQDETPNPVWTRWWFWTAVGAVVIAGGATAYVLTRSQSDCGVGRMCTQIANGP